MRHTFFDAFFSDLFDKNNIIDSRFQVFLRNLIAALINNNPDEAFNTVITDLTAVYTTYFGNFETKNVNIAERMGKTRNLDTISMLFVNAVRSKYSTIEAVFAKGTPTYLEFFPNGLTEFSNISRANILTLSHRMAVKATQYKSQLGGLPFANIFTGFETNITAAIGVQNTGKAVVKTITGEVLNNRAPVEDQAMKAMYLVGAKFWPNQAACRSFFDFSLLFGIKNHPGIDASGIATANASSVCIGTDILPTSVFTLKNISDFPLTFFAAHTANGPAVGTAIVVPPHNQNVSAFADFDAADMLFLYVKNETDFAGNWEVRMD